MVATEVLVRAGASMVAPQAAGTMVSPRAAGTMVFPRIAGTMILTRVGRMMVLVRVMAAMVFAGTVKQSFLCFGLVKVVSFQVEASENRRLFSDLREVFPLLSFSRTALVIPYVQQLAQYLFTLGSFSLKNCLFF